MNRRAAITAALMTLVLASAFAGTKVKMSKLSKKLLYGDQAARVEAVKNFNKLPADEQYKLVPDFMVALGDDNPEVRKIASRILKAMGLAAEAQIPDAKKAMPEQPLPDAAKAMPPPAKNDAQDKWADLKDMRAQDSGNYADLKREIDLEKKGQVTLDAAQFQADSPVAATPLSTVVDSLKDPDPWVRAQAARRLAMIHPAPVETIPTLIDMLGDKEPESRRAAAAALGSFGPLAREAIPVLNKSLADPDNSVSLIAAEALKQIQQP